MSIRSLITQEKLPDYLADWCTTQGISIVRQVGIDEHQALLWVNGRLSLSFPNQKQGDVVVDFASNASEHRRIRGGAFGQPIAKALGLSPAISPYILDLTAGLGRDAYVMASLGAKVEMRERHPIVAALLLDGLMRGRGSGGEVAKICERMKLIGVDSCESELPHADLVYIDPMFPARQKSAAVKKEMKAFHSLVGEDLDSDGLLARAIQAAEYRVVVKRPKGAPALAGVLPTLEHKGKSGRFDIYTKKSLKSKEFKSVIS